MRLIDLSLPISAASPQPDPPRIRRVSHRQGGLWLGLGAAACRGGNRPWALLRNILRHWLFGQRVTARHFPEGMGLAWEEMRCDTHAGTHLDAPWHFGPLCAGRPAPTIEEIPLEWCFADGVRLDFRHKPPGSRILPGEVEEALAAIPYTLKPRDIVLFWTGASAYWREPRYLTDFPGIAAETVRYLVERGVKVMGVDAFVFDRPWPTMVEDYWTRRDPAVLWEAHMVGREVEYCHLENLANLDQLPGPIGFQVICFPVKVERGSAGWARVVALVPEEGGSHGH